MNKLAGSIGLGNWRESPQNQWSFHHVRELIPAANIHHDASAVAQLYSLDFDLSGPIFKDKDGENADLNTILDQSWTDALCIVHKGSIVCEWYAPHYDGVEPHILFSVSKSVTGALAGVLVAEGMLDVDTPVSNYIADADGSAFEDCSVRHMLDMQVGLDFAEVYTGQNAQFNHYRAATGWNPPAPGETAGDLRAFLTSTSHSEISHGQIFRYMSPISDMLGLVLESASGERLSDLISHSIWRPMGAESDAYITVDAKGAPRAAGGICVRPRDLARFGQVMCNGGLFNGNQVIPADWIQDTMTQGNYAAWQQGSFSNMLPEGRYRNQWYQTGNPNGAICAIGIHGQWIYADPTNEVVIVKQSSQPDPVDETLDMMLLDLYNSISVNLGSE
jgi:CubicO group peptidase (beta-lactamase class C family)